MNSIRKIIRNVLIESVDMIKKKRIVAGVLIKCTSTDNVFLILRNDSKPAWAIVSGTIDDGEDVLSGLKREIYEELFVNPYTIDFKFIRIENIPEKNIELHYYEGFVDKQFIPILDEENLDSGWFSSKTIPSPLYAGLPEKIEKIFKDSDSNIEKKSEIENVELVNEVRLLVKKTLREQLITNILF